MSEAENPEEKYKTLINIGIGFSILLIIGIFITIGITTTRIADRPDLEEIYQAQIDSMLNAPVEDSYDYDDAGTCYDGDAQTLKEENDSLLNAIRSTYASSYKQDLLDHLDTETDKCAELIRELIEDLSDTMNKASVSGPGLSSAFFDNTKRDEELFSALFAYRETCEDLAPDAGIYDAVSYRDYFPLREVSAYGYIQTWDEYNFKEDPVEVITYLRHLEMDLRYYENQLLWDLM